MLFTHRNQHGAIEAVCEWWCVDEEGNWSPQGEYVWVNQLEVSEGTDLTPVFRDIIAEIAWAAPHAKGAYWERQDSTKNKLHAFTRSRLVNFKHKENSGETNGLQFINEKNQSSSVRSVNATVRR